MEANQRELTFRVSEGGYCQQCGQQQDTLCPAAVSFGERSQSLMLCRNCAATLTARFNEPYGSQPPKPPQPQHPVTTCRNITELQNDGFFVISWLNFKTLFIY